MLLAVGVAEELGSDLVSLQELATEELSLGLSPPCGALGPLVAALEFAAGVLESISSPLEARGSLPVRGSIPV